MIQSALGNAVEGRHVHVEADHLDTIKKEGKFLIIDWGRKGGERAMIAAQHYLANAKLRQGTITEDEWDKYFSYADAVYENRNVGVTAGLGVLLQAGADLSLGTSAKFGGPNAGTNKAFLGVGDGLVYCTITAGVTAGSSTTASLSAITGGTLAAGDVVMFEDSITLQAQGANPEVALVTNYSAGTLTLSQPVRFTHAINTYVVKLGNPAATNLAGANKTFKGIDSSFPTYSLVSSKATLTWQVTYGTAEAQYAWNECLIAARLAADAPPNAGSGSSGVTTFPASSIILAASSWYPSPLTKGASIISQAYQLSVS